GMNHERDVPDRTDFNTTLTPGYSTDKGGTDDEINPPGAGNACKDISFITGDSINGPVHSNDALLMCGSPVFKGSVTTSWSTDTSGKNYRVGSGCSGSPTFATKGDPHVTTPLTMPPSNSSIKAATLPQPGNTGGCLFTGPTRIVFNSDGTMTVNSPYSQN